MVAKPAHIRFRSLRLNRPCNAGTIGCGALAAGSFSRPLASSVYTYAAAAGESFTLRMLDYTGALQPDLEVYDPQGNPVGQSTSGNVTGVDVAQPAAGAYTVVAMDAGVLQAGGPFGIELLRTKNACSAAPAQGQTVNGVINGAQPFISYSIPATNGDALLVRSASVTPGFAAQMDLYDPTGVRLHSGTFALSQHGLRNRHLHRRCGRFRPAHGRRLRAFLAVAQQSRRNIGFAVWRLHHRIPVGHKPISLLPRRRQCGRSDPADLYQDLRQLLSTDRAVRFHGHAAHRGFRYQPEGQVGRRLPGGGEPLYRRQRDRLVHGGLPAPQQSVLTHDHGLRPTDAAAGRHPRPARCLRIRRHSRRPGRHQIGVAFGQLLPVRGVVRRLRQPAQRRFERAAHLRDPDHWHLLAAGPRPRRVNLGSYRASFQDDYNPCSITDTEPPVVTLLKPTGGEVIAGNTTYRIQWQSDDNVGVVSHDIALSTDGGQTFATAIAGGLAGNTQNFNWFVPPDIAPSRTAVIRVTATDAAGNAQSALSGLLSLIGSGFTPNSTATFTYDSLNRLTQAVLGDGRTIAYTWDAAGNLVAITVSGQ